MTTTSKKTTTFYQILDDYQGFFDHDTVAHLPLEFTGNSYQSLPKMAYYTNLENILDFLHYGKYLYSVDIPNDANCFQNPDSQEFQKVLSWKANKLVISHQQKINLPLIKSLVEEGANPKVNDFRISAFCASTNNLGLLKYIFEIVPDAYRLAEPALLIASDKNHQEIIDYLVSKGTRTAILEEKNNPFLSNPINPELEEKSEIEAKSNSDSDSEYDEDNFQQIQDQQYFPSELGELDNLPPEIAEIHRALGIDIPKEYCSKS